MSGRLSQAFLDQIVANIDDDGTRLVFSDWLEENGQTERAEFIRVQVERASVPSWDAAQVRLRLREQAFLKHQGETWLSEMPKITGAKWEGFRRGVVAEVSFSSFEAMRANAHDCRAVAPVEAVTVHWPRRRESKEAVKPIAELRELTLTGRPNNEEIERLADSPQLATLRVLNVHELDANGVKRLMASPHLAGLRTLRLMASRLGTKGLRNLTEAATLTGLEELDLSGPGFDRQYQNTPIINPVGMALLAGWEGFQRVRSLTMAGSNVGQVGLQVLLFSPRASALKSLSLRTCQLDGQAISEFSDTQVKPQLESLDLGENVLKELGAEYIAVSRCLRELKDLRLDRCEIPLAGARYLAKKATFLNSLRILNVGHNHFGPLGLEALLERKPPMLHTLRLRDNNISDSGVALLAASPASDDLLELDLSHNDLTASSASALGDAAHLAKLAILRVSENKLNSDALATLSASSVGRRLSVIE